MKTFIKENKAPLLVLLAGWLNAVVYAIFKGRALMNSDVSSEFVLANLLNKEGGILSKNWYYSTELRVIHTQLVYKIALRLFPNNWDAARVFSVAVFMAIIAAGALYLIWAARLNRKALWWAAILIFPFSKWYIYGIVENSVYIPYVSVALFACTMILHFIRTGTGKITRIILLALSSVLAFMSGLAGFRLLEILYAPFVLGAFGMGVHLWLKKTGKYDSYSLKQLKNENPQLATLFCLSLFLAIVAFAGVVINVKILAYEYSFRNYSGTTWTSLSLNGMISSFEQLFNIFGWQTGAYLAGPASIVNFLVAVFIPVMVVTIIKTIRRYAEHSLSEQFLIAFTLSMFVINLLVLSSSTQTSYSLYWLPLVPWLLLLMFIGIGKKTISPLRMKRQITAIIAFFVLCSLSSMKNPYIDSEFLSGTLDSRTVQPTIDWLDENGYTQGYASFWNCNVTTALSSGRIEMWSVSDFNTLAPNLEWLEEKQHDTEQPEGSFFIILNENESGTGGRDPSDTGLQSLIGNSQYMVHEDADNKVYVFAFESMDQFHAVMEMLD